MWKAAKAAIFDLDGTLIDSMGIWEWIDIEFLQQRGFEVPQDYMQAVKAMDFLKAADYTVRRFGLNETPQAVMRQWHCMALDAYRDRIQLKPGAKELLQYMREHGLKIGLATASATELYQAVLQSHHIHHYFDAFATTKQAGKPKGDPAVFNLCADRLGVSPQDCIVFEDILAGVQGAKSAGMRVIGVYDRYSAHEEQAIRSLADGYVNDWKQLYPA